MRRMSRLVCGAAALCAATSLNLGIARGADAEARPGAKPAARSDGRELFTREWVPGDKRSHGGDGLGPLFNDSSCVACHNQGGVGGAGPASKNALILTAFRNVQIQQPFGPGRMAPSVPQQIFRSLFGDLDDAPSAQRNPRPPVLVATEPVPAPPAQVAKPSLTTPPVVDPLDLREPVAQPVPGQQPVARAPVNAQQIQNDRKELARLHPGLATASSVVLHRSGTYDEYEAWRQQFVGFGGFNAGGIANADVSFFGEARAEEKKSGQPQQPVGQFPAFNGSVQQLRQEAQQAAQRRVFNQTVQQGNFAVTRSERNTTALFGAGQIDAVPVAVLEALEKKQGEGREVSGRVSRLKDGKAGRFGWKGQTASLDDFVLTACAVELGLNVPGHSQAGVPHKPDYRTEGLDLNAEECATLVSFVRELPAPKQRPLTDGHEKEFVTAGRKVFETVGCAACHAENLDKAEGIYSDLLLHDMGPDLGDSGSSYGIFVPDSSPDNDPAPVLDLAEAHGGAPVAATTKVVGATRQEWRTPPLWGVRDSAPYLHDGRAETLEQAIAFHGGEAQAATNRYFNLSAKERFQVVTFMKSLVAPETR